MNKWIINQLALRIKHFVSCNSILCNGKGIVIANFWEFFRWTHNNRHEQAKTKCVTTTRGVFHEAGLLI